MADESESAPAKLVVARNVAGSGVVLGIASGLLLWLGGYVGPILFIPFVILGAVLGGVLFGIPAYAFERKVMRERRQAADEAAARKAEEAAQARARQAAASPAAAAPAAAPVVVFVGGASGAYAAAQPSVVGVPGYGGQAAGAAAGASSWTPMGSAPTAASPSSSSTPSSAPAKKEPPVWPLQEPLCILETGREKDAWEAARALNLPPEKVIGFTTFPPEEIAKEFGLPIPALHKVSRVEAEANVDPGDLERIGNFIERHLDGGEGRVVVLPSVENLVEAGNVRNVRRLLEVVRDLAQGSHGSMLVTLDPVSLPEAHVTLLERGAFKIERS